MRGNEVKKQSESSLARIEEFEQSEELAGTLGYGSELMHSVLENDAEKIKEGELIQDALNQGFGAFTSDILFEKFVKNYSLAKKLYGETLLRKISGYDPDYIERNIRVPEFQRELKERLDQRMKQLRKDGFINAHNAITESGIEMAALVLCVKELDTITPFGFVGERFQKHKHMYGEPTDLKDFRHGDRYKDIAVQKSVKRAVRRSHTVLLKNDLQVHARQRKGSIEVVYALDASASMKGEKLESAKRAGVSLAFKAIEERDRVGLLAFSEGVSSRVYPSKDFGILLKEIVRIKPGGQTNFAKVVEESFTVFSTNTVTKHLLILSDALPTAGDAPKREALDAVAHAAARGITVTLVGLGLDAEGETFGRRLVEVGGGRFYVAHTFENLNNIVLQDYYAL